MAPDAGCNLGCPEFRGPRRAPIFLLARLGDCALKHVSHRPLRSVWSAPGVSAPTRRRIYVSGLSYAVALPDRAAPDHAWLYHRVLGHAADVASASSFRH